MDECDRQTFLSSIAGSDSENDEDYQDKLHKKRPITVRPNTPKVTEQ